MPFKCSVFSCDSNSDKVAKNAVSFFEFPSTPTRKQNWLESIGRPYFKPVRSSRVCSNHFDEKHFTRKERQVALKSDAVPFSSNSANKATPRLTLNSSRSSEENILLNNNKRVQTASMSEALQIGMKRPRRNTVYMGSYKWSKMIRVEETPTQTTPDDLGIRTPVTRDDQRTKEPKQTTPSLGKNQSSTERQSAKELENVIQRKRNTVVASATPRTNRLSKEPKQVTPSLAKNQSSTEKQSAKVLETVIQRQRNTADIGSHDLDIRTVVASAPRRSNRLSNEPKKPPNNQPFIEKHSGPIIQRQSNAAVNGMSDLSVLKQLMAGSTRSTNRASKVTKKTGCMPSTNQSSIVKFFPKKKISTSKVVEPEESNVEDCIFGWSVMGPHAVPFIVRNSEKFCSLRMFEKAALATYKKRQPVIGPCGANVECFSPTKAQCDLLNEINVRHCDSAFGKEKFSMVKDKLVRLKDAFKYFTFVDLCHEPFMKGVRIQSEGLEFGFTVVNKMSYIPHIILNERKFVPLSYLHCDGEILDVLEEKSQTVSGCDALFLKFCCKFDGISNIGDCIKVIDLQALRRLAPPKTTFKDCWPTATENYQLRVVMTVKGLRLEFVKRSHELK